MGSGRRWIIFTAESKDIQSVRFGAGWWQNQGKGEVTDNGKEIRNAGEVPPHES
jgi:hypothetical protein